MTNTTKQHTTRKPCTELQTLAQRENYALFILRGMLASLHFLCKVTPTNELRLAIVKRISFIKDCQSVRKDAKQNETN